MNRKEYFKDLAKTYPELRFPVIDIEIKNNHHTKVKVLLYKSFIKVKEGLIPLFRDYYMPIGDDVIYYLEEFKEKFSKEGNLVKDNYIPHPDIIIEDTE